MQRFADHPFDTWLLIAKNLKPYETRLRSKSATVGFLESRQRQLAEIGNLFDTNDFIKQGRLDGEFLLGYYCQRQRLHTKRSKPDQTAGELIAEEEGEDE
jgi:CRISPR-associated protein Csd1